MTKDEQIAVLREALASHHGCALLGRSAAYERSPLFELTRVALAAVPGEGETK